jgi:glutamyl-tRNA reductase
MREAAQRGNQQLIDDAVKRLEGGQAGREVIEHLARALSNKILHGPSTRLREAAENQNFDLLAAAKKLFEDAPPGEDEQ